MRKKHLLKMCYFNSQRGFLCSVSYGTHHSPLLFVYAFDLILFPSLNAFPTISPSVI